MQNRKSEPAKVVPASQQTTNAWTNPFVPSMKFPVATSANRTKRSLSANQGNEWTQANVAPILKKGSKLHAVNYRPVSLTYITCKLFEHIMCKHILAHFDDHQFF